MRITRDDVARHAQVSTSVVSYVLNNGPRPVSEERRARVLAAVAELGYRPDGIARDLRSGRSDLIGMILPDLVNPFFAELAVAVENAALERGFGVVWGSSSGDVGREAAHMLRLAERRVAGLIVASTREDQDFGDMMRLSIPVAAVDRMGADHPISTVQVDNRGGAIRATRHLIDHGHARHAMIAGPTASGVIIERVEGWAGALSERGLPADLVTFETFDYDGGYRAAQRFLAGTIRPTAVLTASDVQAIGFIRGARDLGVRVPEDIALVAFDGTRAAAFATPRLGTLSQPTTAMARTAVELVLDHPQEQRHEVLECTLLPAESCGCP